MYLLALIYIIMLNNNNICTLNYDTFCSPEISTFSQVKEHKSVPPPQHFMHFSQNRWHAIRLLQNGVAHQFVVVLEQLFGLSWFFGRLQQNVGSE